MKFDTDTFTEIGDSLLRNKTRSLLTGFGVFWGVFMLLFLVGAGGGFKKTLSKNFEGFATNSAFIVADKTTLPYAGFREGRAWDLTMTDVERLKQMVPELACVDAQTADWGTVAYAGGNKSTSILKGISESHSIVEEPKLKYGRYLNKVDIEQERRVCVIGKNVCTKLFGAGTNPCGQLIKVGSLWFTVVGVDYNESNVSISGSASSSIFIPISLHQKISGRGDGRVDIIGMTGKPGVRQSEIEHKVREVIARAHSISPEDKSAMVVLNTEELFSLMDNLMTGVNILIWLVGLGTILAGVIGISNIMMVTVKERTTEIGIRRAIGATPSDILFQIIAESIALTLVSGMVGIVFSVFLLNVVDTLSSDPAVSYQVGFGVALGALILLSVLGVLAGLAPASRAMNIKPVDAMRDE